MSKNGKHGKERRPCPSGDPSTWQRHQTLCCYLRLKPTQGSADLNGTTVWDILKRGYNGNSYCLKGAATAPSVTSNRAVGNLGRVIPGEYYFNRWLCVR